MLDVAIIGAGLMGRWHLATARSLGARVVGIVDPDRHAAEALAASAPGAVVVTDLKSLFSKVSVHLAHVCSPASSHYGMVLELGSAGIHVLVEKPLTSTLEETRHLLEMAQLSGTLICPVHQYAFQPGMEKAIAALPCLGGVRRFDFNICSAGADEICSADRGAIVSDILPHPISMLQRLSPELPIEHLSWTTLRGGAGDFLATAQHEDLLITFFISLSARPTRFIAEVQCEKGSISIDGFHGFSVHLPGRVSRTAKITFPFTRSLRTIGAASVNLASRVLRKEPAYAGLRSLTARFYEAALSNNPALLPFPPSVILSGAATRDLLRLT
jgi:predicted dehydrogenase